MAQFRAVIQGQKGEASRLGSKKSGMCADVDGWNAGVSVRAFHLDGKDGFRVSMTSGSSPKGNNILLGVISENDDGSFTWFPVKPGKVKLS